MQIQINKTRIIGLSLIMVTASALSIGYATSMVRLNLRPRSRMERPLAMKIGPTTIELRGTVEMPYSYSIQNQSDVNLGPVGDLEISADLTLLNRWNVGVTYFGEYEDGRTDPFGNDTKEYQDHVAAFVNGSWGTVLAGNVAPLVHENTRRKRTAGNSQIAFNDTLGTLNEWSGGYSGRFGPMTTISLIDDDANYDLGITFQRPIGNKDYRFSARHTSGEYDADSGATPLDTKAISTVAELVYGSSRFDVGGGYERLSNAAIEADRWYTSAGFTTKSGVWTLSTEGHYGEIEGQSEIAAAVGVRRDLRRGLSAHVAFNYEDSQVTVGGVTIRDNKDKRITASLRYGF